MPGCGKTRIGRELAMRLGIRFFDLDREIVKGTGKDIPAIFKENGEDYFRNAERNTLHDIVNRQRQFVLATGGGAPCYFDNMAYMNEHGISVFLHVPLEDLYRRFLKGGTLERPLLKNKTPGELQIELQKKYDQRLPYYRQAAVIVTSTFGIVGERVSEIVNLLPESEENSETEHDF